MIYEELVDFLRDRMRMSHVYQPVMLMTLLRRGSPGAGFSSKTSPARGCPGTPRSSSSRGAMGTRVEAHGDSVFVRHRPADVVVAAGVGRPGGILRLVREAPEGVSHQPDVASSQGGPQVDHEAL